MLKLVNVFKDYVLKDQPVVHALNGLSVNFRKNEFVSILGPSGCGKTTLLNIIGGLDKYTSGDLVILGKSTKDFTDRDWDHYRNLRIGFVFQAYNLIPHQTVLQNVELALTISGVNAKERKQRAIEALDKVGLKGLYNKKPNQMSGGQCQRVAIARALVNNPEILLADEPTGALDTKTSIQIMDLIKEVAKDRLVIMVTHNPELAEKYSTRIIKLRDGQVIDDSAPYSSAEEAKEISKLKKAEINKSSKAKMSLAATFKLSGKNLLSKISRTALVAVACSIGIIGVSSVLSVSCGVSNYIVSMQDDMLSSYPVSVTEEAVNMSSLINGLTSSKDMKVKDFDIKTKVGLDSLIAYLMDKYTDITNVKTNNITKTFMKYVEQIDPSALSAINYNYGIDPTNNIFTRWSKSDGPETDYKYLSLNGLTQKYISSLKTVKQFTNYSRYVNLFTNFMKQMPAEEDYVLKQYDLLGDSTFPDEEDELALVVDKDTTLTDLTFAQMGYYTQDQFMSLSMKVIEMNEVKKLYQAGTITKAEYEQKLKDLDEKYKNKFPTAFDYTTLIGSEFYYFPSELLYSYSKVGPVIKNKVYNTIMAGDSYGLTYLSYNPSTDSMTGINYTNTYKTVSLTRKPGTTPKPEAVGIDLMLGEWVGTNYFKVDSEIGGYFSNALWGNTPDDAVNRKGYLTESEQEVQNIGFNYAATAKDEWINNPAAFGGKKLKVTALLRPKASTKFGCLSRGVYYTKALTQRYIEDSAHKANNIIFDEVHGFNKFIGSQEEQTAAFKAYVTYPYTDFTDGPEHPVEKDDGFAMCLNGSTALDFTSLISIGGGINYLEQDRSYYRALTGSKIINPKEPGDPYTFEQLPQSVSFYPTSFGTKDIITRHINHWNDDVDLIIDGKVVPKKDRENITYTDNIAMIITAVNTLIDIVTTALIAFTSLSLLVSCFMIAVITIISVMERIKEIGVIRSLGGRKRDVSALFIAENLITGAVSGVLGVVITYILSLALNGIVSIFGVPAIAFLPPQFALLMIAIAILLNIASGLIPSFNSAKKDPVIALRSE